MLDRGCCLRRFCTGSATASSDRPVWPDQRNEAAEFALCYDPIPLLALPRPGLLQPSFHRGCRHPTASVMTKRVSVNSRCRTLTGKARGLMGCKQNTQKMKNRIALSVSASFCVFCGQIQIRLRLAALGPCAVALTKCQPGRRETKSNKEKHLTQRSRSKGAKERSNGDMRSASGLAQNLTCGPLPPNATCHSTENSEEPSSPLIQFSIETNEVVR